MAYRGRYKPLHPEKYTGNPTKIIYRSLWERRFMRYLDENNRVIRWGSEEVIVPYRNAIDEQWHRYFPDFVYTVKRSDGEEETHMIEIKPYKQTIPPSENRKRTRSLLKEQSTYIVNQCKWEYAEKFCNKKKWSFKVITEKDLSFNLSGNRRKRMVNA